MTEVEGDEISNKTFLKASQIALEEQKKIEQFFSEIITEIGKVKKTLPTKTETPFLEKIFKDEFQEKIEKDFNLLFSENKFDFYQNTFVKRILHLEMGEHREDFLKKFFNEQVKKIVRKNILTREARLDGRKIDEVRPVYANAQRLSKIIHGSGIFYRGETHLLSVLTIGDLADALFLDGMEIQMEKNYIHYYNFPPFSVGETGRLGSPGRREIGHGNLAEKALRRMIPSKEDFPYTMRIVSEVMSSNGSTSMAATCASTLALLSGGVPLKNMVAGVAIGLVQENGEQKILTDILGYEDFYGDMDFKVAGTDRGITAIQLDIKIDGLDLDLMAKILERAEQGRIEILKKMKTEISEPAEMSPQIQRIKRINIPQDKIGLVIGKGGVNIKKIISQSGAKIDIKRDGTVFIYGQGESIQKAEKLIGEMV